ncbi:MAG: FkbM family methyltransferase [Syntrophothermus sp.]
MDKNVFKKFLPVNPVILDAGAFNGDDSIAFSNIFPDGTILSIEPVKSIYDNLVFNTSNYSNIKTFNYALDDTCGKKSIFVSSGMSNQSSSLLEPKEHIKMFPDCKFDNKELVETITINQFVKDNNIDRIDCMWLDLQGNEYKVLQHANDILHTTNAIYSEYSLVEFYDGLVMYDEFKSFIEDIGFIEIVNENAFNYIGVGNSLFIRK